MGDVVVQLPVAANEDGLFGAFVARFIESRAEQVERYAVEGDAPYLMIRSDPLAGEQMRILIFQEDQAAKAFSNAWAAVRSRAAAF